MGGTTACAPAFDAHCAPAIAAPCAPAFDAHCAAPCAPAFDAHCAAPCAPIAAPCAPVVAAPVAHHSVEAWGRPVWKKKWLLGKWKYAGLRDVKYVPRSHVDGVHSVAPAFGTCAP